MKLTLTLAASLLLTNYANAQKVKEANVPTKVKQSFAAKYPNSKIDKWEKEGDAFEAVFNLNNIHSSAVFTANGTFKEIEQRIPATALPAAVITYCTTNFKNHKLTESATITDAQGKLVYEAEMTKGIKHIDVLFDDKGNVLKK